VHGALAKWEIYQNFTFSLPLVYLFRLFLGMKTKHIFLTALILAVCTMSVVAEEASTLQVLTVDEAVRIALDNNLGLRRGAINLATAKRAKDHSWNSLLPTLGAAAMVSHPTSVTGEILPRQTMSPDGRPQDRDVWTPGFQFSAGLTLSTSVFENIKRAGADYEAGVLSYDAARQELELQVRKLFYQILLFDANRELATQKFESAQARHEQSAALARAGQAPHLDELSARVDMENQRPAMRNAEILYENALDTLKIILDIPLETLIKLEGNFAGDLAAGIITDLSIGNGSSQSLEVSRLLQSIQSMEAQRNAVRNGAYIPTLRLSWTSTPMYNLQHQYWNDNGTFNISLGLSLDSYLPWSNAKTQIDTLNDNISAAHIQLTEVKRNQENRINQNIRTIERILESLEATKLNVELAESTYEMIVDAYRRGAADFQRLRSAGDSLEMAKNRLLQEQFNLILALLDLERELNVPFGTLTGTASNGSKL
jgi:outer membrane protein TolC